jgi:tetratricopeptide (TPR) repeat protein
MKKSIHDEAKEKDILQVSGINTMGWVDKHVPTVLTILAALFVVGLALVVFNHFKSKSEITAMESYYKIEKEYLKKKEELKSMGDLEKDYGSTIVEFKNIISKYDGSGAASLSALHLAEIYNQYKKPEEGLLALESQKNKVTDSSLIGGLLLQTYGTLLANQGKCAEASKVWESLLGKKTLSFMESELKIKIALCYELLGDLEKAKSLFQEVSAKGGEGRDGSPFTSQAKQYLRLLNLDLAKKGT